MPIELLSQDNIKKGQELDRQTNELVTPKPSVSVVVDAPQTEASQYPETQSSQLEQIFQPNVETIHSQEPEIPHAPTLEGYDKYNEIVPILNEVANQYNLDPLILAAIILHESNGDSNAEGDSQESIRKSRYDAIKKAFLNNQNYKEYYNALKEKGLVKTEDEFFILTSKFSYGLFQISPQTAALRGYKDDSITR